MELDEVANLLLAWSERHRLVEQAFAEFDRWLEWEGGSVGGVRRPEIETTCYYQSLVFRKHMESDRARVVTCLSLAVCHGLCPFGFYKLLCDLDGRAVEEEVELGSEVPFESLGGGAWYYSGGLPRGERHFKPGIADIPANGLEGTGDIPF